MTTRNRIVLIGHGGRHDEAQAAAAINPGDLIELTTASKVRKHSTVGGRAERMFAKEQAMQGGTIDDQIDADDNCEYHIAAPGDVVLARLAAGQTTVVTSPLTSNGDGTLRVATLTSGQLLYASVAESAEHENTTTEAAFDKSYTLAANSLRAGDVLRIRATVIVNDNNSTDTLTLKLNIGSLTVFTSAAVDVADADVGYIDAIIVVRSVGASGKVIAAGVQGLGVPGTVTAKPFYTAEQTLDTTASASINVSADWSVAHADNEVALASLVVELQRSTQDDVVAIALEALNLSAASDPDHIECRVL